VPVTWFSGRAGLVTVQAIASLLGPAARVSDRASWPAPPEARPGEPRSTTVLGPASCGLV